MATFSPLGLLREAVKAVPAVKWALGITGIVSAIAIIASLGVDLRVAAFGTIVMIILMVLLVVFARLTAVTGTTIFFWPIVILLWSSMLLTVGTAALLFTSVFFRWPENLSYWISGAGSRGGGAPVPALLNIVDDVTQPKKARQEALLRLWKEYQLRDFKYHDLSGLDLPKSGWDRMDFTDARLKHCAITDTIVRDVQFVRADLSDADFTDSDLRGSALNGVVMLRAKCEDANFGEVSLRAGHFDFANFSGANLAFANLEAGSFRQTDFSGADLRGANLFDGFGGPTDVTQADLRSAKLEGADLRGTVGLETAELMNAEYNDKTQFPKNFDPRRFNMVKLEQQVP
jgi:uncharacterized protein YjbI with pentapeptide repeats